jgi:hypothetical protein
VTVGLHLRLQESQTTTSAAGRGRVESAGCLVQLRRRKVGNGRCAPQQELEPSTTGLPLAASHKVRKTRLRFALRSASIAFHGLGRGRPTLFNGFNRQSASLLLTTQVTACSSTRLGV